MNINIKLVIIPGVGHRGIILIKNRMDSKEMASIDPQPNYVPAWKKLTNES